MTSKEAELICVLVFFSAVALYTFCVWYYFRAGSKNAKSDYKEIAAELEKATFDQVQAMRTLSAFRRQYHDGTGALVNEVHKLTRAIERLKKRLDEKKI